MREQGIAELGSRNYGEKVRKAGFTNRESYIKGIWQKKVPLQDEYLAFQRDAAAAFVKDLGGLAEEIAGHPIPVGVNSYNLSRDGKKILIRKSNALYIFNAAASEINDLSDHQVDLSGFGFALDVREDWRQIFVDAWRSPSRSRCSLSLISWCCQLQGCRV